MPLKPVEVEQKLMSYEALQSSVKSLQKLVAQKEETIVRYQGLLKEDRDKHSEAAARLQEEIRSLRSQIAGPRDQDEFRKDNDLLGAFLLWLCLSELLL